MIAPISLTVASSHTYMWAPRLHPTAGRWARKSDSTGANGTEEGQTLKRLQKKKSKNRKSLLPQRPCRAGIPFRSPSSDRDDPSQQGWPAADRRRRRGRRAPWETTSLRWAWARWAGATGTGTGTGSSSSRSPAAARRPATGSRTATGPPPPPRRSPPPAARYASAPLPPSLLDCIVCLFVFSCPPFIQGSVRLVYDLCYFRCFKLSYILLTVMFVNGMNRRAVYVLGNASMSHLGLVGKWY